MKSKMILLGWFVLCAIIGNIIAQTITVVSKEGLTNSRLVRIKKVLADHREYSMQANFDLGMLKDANIVDIHDCVDGWGNPLIINLVSNKYINIISKGDPQIGQIDPCIESLMFCTIRCHKYQN